MKKLHYLLFCLYCLLMSTFCLAQTGGTADERPQMATGMRADGKIYVVVAVVVTILAGICFYLIYLDRKISRLEKESQG